MWEFARPRRCLTAARILLGMAVMLAVGQSQAKGEEERRTLVPVRFEAESGLEKVLGQAKEPPEAPIAALVDAISVATGHGVVLVGDLRLSEERLASVWGKPARSGMALLLEVAPEGWRWEKHAGFLFLRPPDLRRGDAVPVSLEKRYPVLRRTVRIVIGPRRFSHAVRNLGRDTGVLTLLLGAKDLGPAENRVRSLQLALPCVLAARGKKMDQVMQALTALTGFPWDVPPDRRGDTFVLCGSGAPITDAEWQRFAPTLAAHRFVRVLSPRQLEQLSAAEGLLPGQLTPAQARELLACTGEMRAVKGVAPGDMVLRFLPTSPGVPRSIYIFGRLAGQERVLGSLDYD